MMRNREDLNVILIFLSDLRFFNKLPDRYTGKNGFDSQGSN